ncbi:DUF3365 domain-containing protein [uncultured Pontibacter sp.]|uniref:Tll0287-like domain-containing protein n=1 Tax=uncultured Pontibacter sp. TaxID=453356 RepID=UPI0026148DBC|nr:DUF3365 domain-containing protein [uncultured Pontibacter sp.]
MLATITLTTAFIVSGCDVKVKPIEGGKEIAQELERHKIKRLTQQDILNAALKHGDSIVVVAQRLQDTRLVEHLEQGGVAAAMPYCQPENYEEVEALQDKFGAISRRISMKPRNPKNKPDALANDALARYSKGQERNAKVEAINQEELLYTAPIYLRNESCLRCHGTVGQDIAEADYAIIKQKYPDDQAINYKKGDLMGVWQLTFDKSDLVAYLNDQPKKSRRPR